MTTYKFSIIIPHRNIPDLLQRCLDSIPQRDDVQVIIVDDNSDADKVDFERFPGLGYPNTEVYFDKSGKGAGRARNVGLEHAKGEWVIFADCDDYFHTTNLSQLMSSQIDKNINLVVWGIEHLLFDHKTWTDFVDEGAVFKPISKAKILNRFSPWRKMIRLEHVIKNNLTFEEIPASNDVMFHTKLMGCTQDDEILWCPKLIYTWEQRKESITHKPSLKKSTSRLGASLRANRYAAKKGWGQIDNTFGHLQALKKISKLTFYFCFYYEAYYLGISKACTDYENICYNDSDRVLLHTNPFLLYKTIRRKMSWY